jgi:transcription elongation factor Elf1
MKIIKCEKDWVCSVCGKKAEVRPYGKGGALVCFQCGMTYEAEAKRQFVARLNAGEN